jgi:hypothetical protein
MADARKFDAVTGRDIVRQINGFGGCRGGCAEIDADFFAVENLSGRENEAC